MGNIILYLSLRTGLSNAEIIFKFAGKSTNKRVQKTIQEESLIFSLIISREAINEFMAVSRFAQTFFLVNRILKIRGSQRFL